MAQNYKEPTQYIIDYVNHEITTKAKIKQWFIKKPEEFRWDFCNSHEEFIEAMQKSGQLLVIKPNGYIMSNKILSPQQYANQMNIKCIDNNIILSHFDAIVGDGFNLWNYPLDEYKHIVENSLKVVVVRFKEGYRFVEVK